MSNVHSCHLTTWTIIHITWFAMFAVTKGSSFLLREVKWHVSLPNFSLPFVWFWYPAQHKAQMWHLLFSSGLACCNYCCSAPSWKHSLHQQAHQESHWCQQWVLVSPTKEGLAEAPEQRNMDLFCNRKNVLGSLRWEREKEKEMECLIVTTSRIIHCPWGEK